MNSRMIMYAVDPTKRTTIKRGEVRVKKRDLEGNEQLTCEESNRVQDEDEVSVDRFICTTRLGTPVRRAAKRERKPRTRRTCAYRITATNKA
jgi:hypothetical protein